MAAVAGPAPRLNNATAHYFHNINKIDQSGYDTVIRLPLFSVIIKIALSQKNMEWNRDFTGAAAQGHRLVPVPGRGWLGTASPTAPARFFMPSFRALPEPARWAKVWSL